MVALARGRSFSVESPWRPAQIALQGVMLSAPMGRVVRFWPKNWRLGPSGSQIRFYPVGFFFIGLHKKTDPVFRSKSKNLKLGIGSHKKSEPDEDRGGSDQMDFFYSQLNLKGLP